jgi:DNA-binding transcriptional LysR family regulator
MDTLKELRLYLAIVEEGSQTAAAKKFGCSLQSVNRVLAKVERDVGVELIRRTTRRSVATEAGMAFYRRIKPAVEEISEARLEAMDRRSEPRGLLRISSPSMFAASHVIPALKNYQEKFPDVDIDLCVSDSPVDVIGGGFDLSIRIRELPDSTLRASRLGTVRIVTYAATCYLDRNGRPAVLSDLERHSCLRRDLGETSWTYRDNGVAVAVAVNGSIAINDVRAMRAAVLNGMGIARGPHWHVSDLVESGEVELLLEQFEPLPLPIHAVFPPSPLRPAKTRMFLKELRATLGHAFELAS